MQAQSFESKEFGKGGDWKARKQSFLLLFPPAQFIPNPKRINMINPITNLLIEVREL